MRDEYFGIKELYEVVLKAQAPMVFGSRRLEAGEPVLYFEKVNMSTLSERNSPIMARGGWSNLPRVIWEDRSEVRFSLTEGVVSSISLGILLSAVMKEPEKDEPILIPMREGPFYPDEGKVFLTHEPIMYPKKKIFIYEYDREVAQKKIYGQRLEEEDTYDDFMDKEQKCLKLYQDKECTIPADESKKYIVDYYYQYTDEALVYTIEKERFNGLFTLEGKFYSKDENDGLNYTNLIYMPKVRIVSDINLRLGERADPTTSVFNIIGLPETVSNSRKGLILEITHLNRDIDASE